MDTESVAQTIGAYPVSYKVKTEQFEGPLDLLLTLIEKRKLFIGDFALARVADDYIEHIRRFESFPVADVANFLLVASTLVLIKSKSILPDLNLTKDEEANIDDLKRRLQMYELYRELSLHIKQRFGQRLIFERSGRPEMLTVFAPDKRLDVPLMNASMRAVLSALPKKIEIPKATVRKVVSIEEMMSRLALRVTNALKTSFANFSRYQKGKSVEKEHRIEIIVSFLAVLELVKQGVVHVTQHEEHGDIEIETHQFGTPNYSA